VQLVNKRAVEKEVILYVWVKGAWSILQELESGDVRQGKDRKRRL